MRTPDSRFYCPQIQCGRATLDENESAHAVKVCRAAQGDVLELCDGQGHFAHGTIVVADPRACQVEISQVETPKPQKPLLNLAIACLKDDALEEVVFPGAQEFRLAQAGPPFRAQEPGKPETVQKTLAYRNLRTCRIQGVAKKLPWRPDPLRCGRRKDSP